MRHQPVEAAPCDHGQPQGGAAALPSSGGRLRPHGDVLQLGEHLDFRHAGLCRQQDEAPTPVPPSAPHLSRDEASLYDPAPDDPRADPESVPAEDCAVASPEANRMKYHVHSPAGDGATAHLCHDGSAH